MNMKKRLETELIILGKRLSTLEPEIVAYERAEHRMKRIDFLIESRK